jgi:hypothetical protein
MTNEVEGSEIVNVKPPLKQEPIRHAESLTHVELSL